MLRSCLILGILGALLLGFRSHSRDTIQIDSVFSEEPLSFHIIEPVSNLLRLVYPDSSDLLVRLPFATNCEMVGVYVDRAKDLSTLNSLRKVYLEKFRLSESKEILFSHLLNLSAIEGQNLLAVIEATTGKRASLESLKGAVDFTVEVELAGDSFLKQMPDSDLVVLQFKEDLEKLLVSGGEFRTNKMDLVCDIKYGKIKFDINASFLASETTSVSSEISLEQVKSFITKAQEVPDSYKDSKNPKILSAILFAQHYSDIVDTPVELFGWNNYSTLLSSLSNENGLVTDMSISLDVFKKFIREDSRQREFQMQLNPKVVP